MGLKKQNQMHIGSSAGDYSSAPCNPVYLVQSLHSRHHNRSNKASGAIRPENDSTELSGEGGSGKTQLCLSAILDCVMTTDGDIGESSAQDEISRKDESPKNTETEANFNSTNTANENTAKCFPKAIYISTKLGAAPTIAQRLGIMAYACLGNHSSRHEVKLPNHSKLLESQVTSVLSRIYLISIGNEDDLMEFLVNSLPLLLKQQHQHSTSPNDSPIGKVILDDIATLYRFSDPSLNQYDNHHSTTATTQNQYYARDRSKELWTISSTSQ
jgi:hypothetical protein